MTNPSDPLAGPWLKVNRAKETIDEFETRYNDWKLGMYVITVEPDPNGLEQVAKAKQRRSFPPQLSCVIGDAIHNLRVALDHLAFILATRIAECQDEGVLTNCYFPIGADAKLYETCLTNGKKSGFFNDAIVDFFMEFEPYPRGKHELLRAIHKLDIADKHRSIIDLSSTDQMRLYVGGHRRWIHFAPGAPSEVEIERLPLGAPEPDYHAAVMSGVLIHPVKGVKGHSLSNLGAYRRAVHDVLNRASARFFPGLRP